MNDNWQISSAKREIKTICKQLIDLEVLIGETKIKLDNARKEHPSYLGYVHSDIKSFKDKLIELVEANRPAIEKVLTLQKWPQKWPQFKAHLLYTYTVQVCPTAYSTDWPVDLQKAMRPIENFAYGSCIVLKLADSLEYYETNWEHCREAIRKSLPKIGEDAQIGYFDRASPREFYEAIKKIIEN